MTTRSHIQEEKVHILRTRPAPGKASLSHLPTKEDIDPSQSGWVELHSTPLQATPGHQFSGGRGRRAGQRGTARHGTARPGGATGSRSTGAIGPRVIDGLGGRSTRRRDGGKVRKNIGSSNAMGRKGWPDNTDVFTSKKTTLMSCGLS